VHDRPAHGQRALSCPPYGHLRVEERIPRRRRKIVVEDRKPRTLVRYGFDVLPEVQDALTVVLTRAGEERPVEPPDDEDGT
jgi:hypothetical protein